MMNLGTLCKTKTNKSEALLSKSIDYLSFPRIEISELEDYKQERQSYKRFNV